MKYFHLFVLEIKKSFHFKVDIASNLLFLPLKLLVISALWKTLFQNAQTIGNFTYQEMVFYYFLIAVLEFAINPFAITCYSVMQDIRMGKLDIYLTKPMNFTLKEYVYCSIYFVFCNAIAECIILYVFVYSQFNFVQQYCCLSYFSDPR